MLHNRKIRLFLVVFLISTVSTIIASIIGSTGFSRWIELKLYDNRMMVRGELESYTDDILLVTVGDYSLQTLPQSRLPLPREYYARAIRNLFEAGAEIVVLEIMFNRPSDAFNDSILVQVTSEFSEKIIHLCLLRNKRSQGSSDYQVVIDFPFDTLLAVSKNFGLANVFTDKDGFVRRYPLFRNYEDSLIPSLALKAVQLYSSGERPGNENRQDKMDEFENIIDRHILDSGEIRINYRGPAGIFPRISLSEVLDDSNFTLLRDDNNFMERYYLPIKTEENYANETDEINPFKGKIVLIGNTIPESHDLQPTPFFAYEPPSASGSMNVATFGVEIQANAISSILDRNYITEWSPLIQRLFLFVICAIALNLVFYLKPVWSLGACLALAIIELIASYASFNQFNLLIPIVEPVLGIIVAFVLAVSIKYKV